MIVSERLIDELIATLHFHGYFHLMTSDAYGNGPLNLVATQSQKKIIQQYIDDVFIDLFFRTHNFKPIYIPKEWNISRHTQDGRKNTDEVLQLNLNDPLDRCSFVSCISSTLWGGPFSQLFPNNKFINDIYIKYKKYGPIWECTHLCLKEPHDDGFEQYLDYVYGSEWSKYKPLFRAQELIDYSEIYHSELRFNCNKYISNIIRHHIYQRMDDYQRIKDMNVFGEYTIEDIFIIYCLLVDKLKMDHGYHYNRPSDKWMYILTFLGLFAKECKGKQCILNDFLRFENEHQTEECIEPYIRDKDLFLRFTNAEKSKAIKFNYINNSMVELSFFRQKPIRTPYIDNTIPLPFLHDEIYNL